jgi:mono/diheme cytochrome c family protein
MKKMMKSLSALCLLTFVAFVMMSGTTSAQEKKPKPWNAPETAKKMKNPVKPDDENMKAAKALYAKHCKSCHGAAGKGDGPKSRELETPCGDFTEAKFKAQTDGEIFWKVKEGRDDMPSFKKKISDDEEIWQIVNYVRTLK